MHRLPRLCVSLALTALLAATGVPTAAATAAAGAEARARVIVKLKPPVAATSAARVTPLAERLERAAVRHGAKPQAQRSLGGEVRLLTATGIDSATLARQLAADPEVAYAVPDRRMRRNVVPNDPLYDSIGGGDPEAGQWYLRPHQSTPFKSAIDARLAWDITKGNSSIVVAVLDTGVRFDHPDLDGKLLPGYDFIRDAVTAADGNGRDADASDPGDWVTVEEVQRSSNDDLTEDCLPRNSAGQLVDVNSSWHGTKVAGIVGALTNNAEGIASVGWNVRVLPVRVLGKCGGFESDIVVAMRWAAGMSVDGVPDNPAANRARIINLSLGGTGACRAAYADAVADLAALGVTVVASAGNTAGHAVSAPANCEGVIGVGGLRHVGTKVGFSDLGPEVAISAPGGNCVFVQQNEPCLYPFITTTNAGTTAPLPASAAYTNGSDDIAVGTSFSAPLVSGVAALMLSVQPELTPDEVRARLQATARPFPATGAEEANTKQCTAPRFDGRGDPIDQLECYCTTETCGAGMLDAGAAVQSALGTVARISLVGDDDPQAGEPLTLAASDSLLPDGSSIASVQWTLVDDGGIVDGFDTAADEPTVQLTPRAGGDFTVRARVEDSEGNVAEQTVRVAVQGRSRGGGGGGAMGWGYLLALLAALPAVRRAVQGRSEPAGRAPVDLH